MRSFAIEDPGSPVPPLYATLAVGGSKVALDGLVWSSVVSCGLVWSGGIPQTASSRCGSHELTQVAKTCQCPFLDAASLGHLIRSWVGVVGGHSNGATI